MPHAYEWAIFRVVPRVERCEFVNAGVLVYCQSLNYLDAAVHLDDRRARALDEELDADAVRRHLEAVRAVAAGAEDRAAGARPQGERFRWLTAPRSTVVQPSPIHTGLTDDPAAELRRLLDLMVRPRGKADTGPR